MPSTVDSPSNTVTGKLKFRQILSWNQNKKQNLERWLVNLRGKTIITNIFLIFSDTNRRSSDEIPSVIGFFNRRESGASLTSGNHRRNSELEMKHQDGLNEADIEARRQKRSLKKQQRKNTASISEEPTTTPDDNTKL